MNIERQIHQETSRVVTSAVSGSNLKRNILSISRDPAHICDALMQQGGECTSSATVFVANMF